MRYMHTGSLGYLGYQLSVHQVVAKRILETTIYITLKCAQSRSRHNMPMGKPKCVDFFDGYIKNGNVRYRNHETVRQFRGSRSGTVNRDVNIFVGMTV